MKDDEKQHQRGGLRGRESGFFFSKKKKRKSTADPKTQPEKWLDAIPSGLSRLRLGRSAGHILTRDDFQRTVASLPRRPRMDGAISTVRVSAHGQGPRQGGAREKNR